MPLDDPNEKWELPPNLRITNPDVLARAEKMRFELAMRVNSPFGNVSPQEQERANAAVMADHLKKDLERVSLQITEIVASGQDNPQLQQLQEARYQISARLAEAYASTGRFDLAAETEPNAEARDEYVKILGAINRPDDEWNCQCAPGRDYVLKDVFSLRHGRVISIRKCSGCGEMNAGALPVHLAEQRAHRAKAREMVAGKTPDEARAILTAAGHTTERLMKR